MPNRKSICILSLSPIATDGRVLRQIEYLVPHYDLTVITYGPAHPAWAQHPNIRWVLLPRPRSETPTVELLKKADVVNLAVRSVAIMQRVAFRASLYVGKHLPAAYGLGYTVRWGLLPQLDRALAVRHDAFHANDWNTLQIAAQAAAKHQARFVVDLHEYAPLEFENRSDWGLFEPMIRYMIAEHATKADAVMTVASAIAERYEQEFKLKKVMVVLNAPEYVAPPSATFDPHHIRLVHHGVATPFRQPDVMIRALALADERYTLHLMLMPSPYIQELKKLADEIAPGRVFFDNPVPPEKIVPTIAQYDVGFNFIAPTNYNYLVCLPNKFFESLNAGLAICTGPSPSMAEIVQKYQCGVVANSFEPQDLAAVLNATTAEQWQAMQQGARAAAKELNAAQEMNKVVQLYQRLFAEQATG